MNRFERDAPAGVVDGGETSAPRPHEIVQADARKENLALRIARRITEQTTGGILDLRVEISSDGIRLSGSCSTYYSKQLAQHAAMSVADGHPLINDIHVS